MTKQTDTNLEDWRARALACDSEIKKAIIGQDRSIRLLLITVFARGHALLEGGVGVGKTTLLRALARVIGGDYERIEGTIDLMPSDLIYHTYINEEGRPAVDPGPILRHGDKLATFFFNEVNRAIHRAETNVEPTDELNEVRMRKERMYLKDQIAGMLG